MLQLIWLEMHGQPLAAEYMMMSGDTMYAYQSGFDSQYLDVTPGNLSTLCSIRLAIQRGCRVFDFMRGDEQYKQRWGAVQRAAYTIGIRRRNGLGRCRHLLSVSQRHTKDWLKSARKLATAPSSG